MADTPRLGTRGIYGADLEQHLPYGIFDGDHHLYAPDDAVTRYLAPDMIERAWLPGEPRMLTEEEHDDETGPSTRRAARSASTRSPRAATAASTSTTLPEMEGNIPIPGAMLNRLNPMRDLDELAGPSWSQRYNEMRPAFEHKDPRLGLMDVQGVQVGGPARRRDRRRVRLQSG